MSFTLKHARYFVATARAGQVSRAAVELNVSQSAVTAAIHQLEGILGLELFERRANGMALTHAGSRFLHHAEHIVAAVNEASRISAEAPSVPSGRMRIGMTYTVAGYFAAPLLVRAKRLFPGIDLVIREAPRGEIETGIVRGDLDFAIILTSNLRNSQEISHETLLRSTRRLWLPPEHPLSRKDLVSLADVAAEPYIGLTVDEAMLTQRSYWQIADVRPNVIFETSSVEAVRSMVAAGMGVTVLSDMVYRPWSLDGQRIDTCTLTDDIPSMDVGIAWNSRRELPGPIELMFDFLRRNASYDRRDIRGAARALPA